MEISDQYDGMLVDDSNVAVIQRQQILMPSDGPDGVFMPPTYPPSKGGKVGVYNMDEDGEGTFTVLVNSMGAEANAIEEAMKAYPDLIPTIVTRIATKDEPEGRLIDLLDTPHRLADSLVRFSTGEEVIHEAFVAAHRGNHVPLAKLSPMSLLLGVWDSRATHVKLPRIVTSVVRAHRARLQTRSAVYAVPIDYVEEGVIDPPKSRGDTEDKRATLGFANAPATGSPGGIVADEIVRVSKITLSNVRKLRGETPEETLWLRRYILGLALVITTLDSASMYSLRSGTDLVERSPSKWETVTYSYHAQNFNFLPPDQYVLSFAREAAAIFGVGPDREWEFDVDRAKRALAVKK